MNQNTPAPAILDGLTDVPFSLSRDFHPVQDDAVMEPGNLCSKLLHNLVVRPGVSKGSHVLQVARRKACHFREGLMQIGCQPVDNLCAPTLLFLPSQNVSADAPVKQYQLPIDGQRSADLSVPDSVFQVLQERFVSLGQAKPSNGHQFGPPFPVTSAGAWSGVSIGA